MATIELTNKSKLYEELCLKNKLQVEGLNFEPDIFKHLDVGGEIKEVVNALFARDHHAHREVEFPESVFGKFKVRSTFVSGLETKESLLEGIEHLVSKGVIALPSQWNVNVGSALEGHRTPSEDWHWDVFERTVSIYRKYGLTWDELSDATAEANTVAHDLFRLEEGIILS